MAWFLPFRWGAGVAQTIVAGVGHIVCRRVGLRSPGIWSAPCTTMAVNR